jgi:hypothetical protein
LAAGSLIVRRNGGHVELYSVFLPAAAWRRCCLLTGQPFLYFRSSHAGEVLQYGDQRVTNFFSFLTIYYYFIR